MKVLDQIQIFEVSQNMEVLGQIAEGESRLLPYGYQGTVITEVYRPPYFLTTNPRDL